MIEFDTLLKEYRTLAIQVDDEEHYLEHLKTQLVETEKRLKEILEKAQQPAFSTNWLYGSSPGVIRQFTHQPELSALEETVQMVAEMGGSVSAEQLAKRLNITRDAARLRLQRAARNALIARIGLGRYRALNKTMKNGTDEKASAQTESERSKGQTDDAST
jgi:hypothetical protein